MKSIIRIIIVFVLNMIIFPLISSEFFTAIVHLEKLLNTEKQIVGSLEKYLSQEEERLSQLRKLSAHYSRMHSISNKDVDNYLANPINAYLLVRQLTTDWKRVEHLIRDNKSDFIDVLQKNEIFPSDEDLSGIHLFRQKVF